jgi:2-polyprenyl-3-methyl-5-hydroxy-6-metoxy-1,4-benzoquinol methylase
MLNRKELFDILIEEADHAFTGWDFSYISSTARVQSEPLPWNYGSILFPYIRSTKSLLDMGTGGGELLSLLQPLPQRTCATEAYKPNVSIAKSKLSPLGVDVFPIKDDRDLPFHENEFEIIINRHEKNFATLWDLHYTTSGGAK